MEPRVSVIMLVLNGERFIDVAIQSIVDQTYKNCELVIVDDGSTDSTPQHVDSFRAKVDIRYVRHDVNQGIARSVNDGLRHATGELIAFLDHDDAWFPEFLETQTQYLQEHPDIAIVHSDFETIDAEGKTIERSVAALRRRPRPSGDVFPQLFMESFIVGNSVLIRRECFRRLGGFDESLRWGDYHLWLRFALHYKVDYVDKILTKYRQHSSQDTRAASTDTSHEVPVGLLAIEKILAQYPEAHRRLGGCAIRRRRASFHYDVAYGSFSKGDVARARNFSTRAVTLWPFNLRYLKLYAFVLARALKMRVSRLAGLRLPSDTQAGGGVRGITG